VLKQLRSTPLRGATLGLLRSSPLQRRAATHPPATLPTAVFAFRSKPKLLEQRHAINEV
jgi:hypothetical protein